MSDSQPPRPAPLPPPDPQQIQRLNDSYNLTTFPPQSGWQRQLVRHVDYLLSRLLFRQREFNAAVVDHLNRRGVETHEASARALDWTESRIEGALDELRRYQQSLTARDRRHERVIASMTASQEELRTSVGGLHQAVQQLKREVARLAEQGVSQPASPAVSGQAAGGPATAESLESHKYVGFEDAFRGSRDDIRARLSDYLAIFDGQTDVLDIGCGRGEFLALLRERGVRARGIDINSAMVDECRQQGLDASVSDALSYLRSLPDGSLGGLIAAQVIEHLEPRDLTALLSCAFDKLRPGAPIVLETINPACWFAFFESYIRDLTHVRPIHPDTLKYLLVASGFLQVEIRYRAPYPEHDKLQPIPASAALAGVVDTLNANVERLNRLLFTWLDYAAIGRRA
jgi:2-polyprenyl-3-methyl-5-hydroxy-6-metoxy-1,4-benzoquinol methylase